MSDSESLYEKLKSMGVQLGASGLYRGPGLGYGVADQKMFPRGDVFTVISWDSSGYWFFSKSTDGLEGWLYLEWINSDFDLLAIPTIAYVPPPPPTATRKPKLVPPHQAVMFGIP